MDRPVLNNNSSCTICNDKLCYLGGEEDFFFERVAMAFPKDSPWIGKFNDEINKILQGGLIQYWKQVIKGLFNKNLIFQNLMCNFLINR